jgi:hypothetical protein
VRVRLDQFQIAAGASLRDALETGLRESDVFVALIDPGSSLKPNFFFELGAALGMGKRVVPIVPRELDNSTLPLELRSRRYLMKDSPEDTAEELAHAFVAAYRRAVRRGVPNTWRSQNRVGAVQTYLAEVASFNPRTLVSSDTLSSDRLSS